MKKRSSKKGEKKVSKKAEKYDLFDKIAITAATLMILLALTLFYNLGTVGKAITAPSPPVDLTTQESEDLDLSAYNKIEIKLRLSGDSEVSEFTLSAEQDGGLTYYHLTQGEENVFAYGILSANLANSGNLYLNDDNIGDLELTLNGDLLTVTNPNFVEPDAAEFEIYDEELIPIMDDIIDAELNQELIFHIEITSTSLPEVTVTIDGAPAVTEEVDSGSDFVMLKVTFTGTEEKPHSLEVTANVGGEKTTKNFILAVNGHVYRLVEDGYTINLVKDNGNYEAMYELEKTSELQPVSLLCGELDLIQEQDAADSIEKILSYDSKVEQWKENIPSEFGKLVMDKGYLIDLKDGAITFTVECDGKPLPQTPILSLGWNLLGTNGYKAADVADLKTTGGVIAGIYEYGDSQPLNLNQLPSGKVYWVKVE